MGKSCSPDPLGILTMLLVASGVRSVGRRRHDIPTTCNHRHRDSLELPSSSLLGLLLQAMQDLHHHAQQDCTQGMQPNHIENIIVQNLSLQVCENGIYGVSYAPQKVNEKFNKSVWLCSEENTISMIFNTGNLQLKIENKSLITSLFLSLCLERNIVMGRVDNGHLILDGATLYVEFSQQDACLPSMADRVKTDLRTEETIILCDGQGNRLVESSGTSGT